MLITIAGDSWGYCWNDQGQAEPGLEKLLIKKGHTVINLAVPGSCNRKAVARLTALTSKTDLVLFIQTEPIREWMIEENSVDLSGNNRAVVDAQRLFDQAVARGSVEAVLLDQLKNNTYHTLSRWQKRTSTPVLMIGGCSGIDPANLPDNLIPAVPSWPLLLLGQDRYPENMFVDTAQWLSWEYADLVHESKNLDLMLEWYDITKRLTVKLTAWFDDQIYFNPDNYHPNYLGHQRLVESLEPYFQRYR
jgi:hypothetical protein